MTVGSILLGVALLLLVALFIFRPFLMPTARNQRPLFTNKQQLSQAALLARKEALLNRVRDLDFDHETGKLPAIEHQQQRLILMNEAAAILRQLDQPAGDEPTAIVPPAADEIEAAIARLRQANKPAPAPGRPAASSNGRDQINFCPQCGKPADPTDRFCAYCGHAFRRPQPA
jgi:hypothetical protein